MTATRITSEELLKQRNRFLIREGYGSLLTGSSQIALTMPLPDRLAAAGVYAAARLGRLRLSPHVYNDEEDCARCVDALNDILN